MKWCPGCDTRKPLSAFSPRSAPRQYNRRTYCKPCEAAKARDWQRNHPERHRATWRKSEARRMADPERGPIRRDQIREARRRSNRVTPDRHRTPTTPTGGTRHDLLPSAPLAVLLRQAQTADLVHVAAESLGISGKTFQLIRDGDRQTVTVALADQVCTRLGLVLGDVYPEWREGAAA